MAETTENIQTESPSVKFKYGELEIDTNKLSKYLHENALGWLLHSGYGNDLGVKDSINDMIRRIQSGDIESLDYSDTIHSKTGFDDSSYLKHFLGIKTGKTTSTNLVAKQYLSEALAATSLTPKEEEKAKEKFTTGGLHKAWLNRYFGGNESTPDNIEAAWLNRDAKAEDGTRARINRLNEYANFLDEYATSTDLDNYDYTGSAFTNALTYRDRLKAAALAARAAANGLDSTWNDFVSSYAAAGGTDSDILFTKGDAKAKTEEKSEILQELEAYEKDLDPSMSQEDRLALIEAKRKELLNAKYGDLYSTIADEKYRQLYEDYANSHYTGHGSEVIADLGTHSIGNLDRWYGNKKEVPDDGEKVSGYFDDDNHKAYALRLLNTVLEGKSIEGTAPLSGKSNGDILRAYMYALKNKDTSEFKNTTTPIGEDEYFLNDSFNINDGTGIKYNFKTRKFIRVHVDPNTTPKLAAALKAKWQQSHKKQQSKYANKTYTWAKNGAKLESLRKLRLGDNFAKVYNLLRKNEQEQAILNEMDATGRTKEQVEAGHGLALIGSNRRKGSTEVQMTTADWMRLGSALNDIASIGVSYTGAGMPVAAGMLLVGLGVDTAADIIDPSKTWGDVGENLLMNAGLAGATAIGGGALAKAGKAGKVLKTLIPVALSSWGASSLMEDPSFKKTWKKITTGNWKSVTSNDLRNIKMLTSLVTGARQGVKSAVGAIGTNYGNLKSVHGRVIRGIGKWGNNAWKSDATTLAKAKHIADSANASKWLKFRANNILAKLQNYNELNGIIDRGGLQNGVLSKTSNGKVKVGGVEINKETAILMDLARKTASKKAGATDLTVKLAVLDAYRNSEEGKATIRAGHPEVAAHTISAFTAANEADLFNALTPQAEGTGFKINGETFAGDKKFTNSAFGSNEIAAGDLGPKLLEIYTAKANATTGPVGGTPDEIAAAKHAAGLAEVNKVFGELFNTPAQAATPETGMPTFVLNNLKGNHGLFDVRRFGGRGSLDIEDNSPGWLERGWRWINPKTTDRLDLSTPEGRANYNLLKSLRNKSSYASYNPWGENVNSDVMFNTGFGFTKTDWNNKVKEALEYGKPKHDLMILEKALKTQKEALRKINLRKVQNIPNDDKIFKAMVHKTPELASKNEQQLAAYMRTLRSLLGVDESVSNRDILSRVRIEAKRNGFPSISEYIKDLGSKYQQELLNAFIKGSTGKAMIKNFESKKGSPADPTELKAIHHMYLATLKAAESLLGKTADGKHAHLNNKQKTAIQKAIIDNINSRGLSGSPKHSYLSYNQLIKALGTVTKAPKAGHKSNPLVFPAPLAPSITPKNIGGLKVIDLRDYITSATKNKFDNAGNATGTKTVKSFSPAALKLFDDIKSKNIKETTEATDLADWATLLGVSTPKAMYELPTGELVLRKQGGKVNPLKSLKSGGILKAEPGTKINGIALEEDADTLNNTIDNSALELLDPLQGMSGNAENKQAHRDATPGKWQGVLDNLKKHLNPWDIALLSLGLHTNKELEKLGLLKGTALDSYTSKHLLITGPFSRLQNSLAAANEIANQGNFIAKNTSDMSLGAAAMLESARNANKARMQAFADYDDKVLESKDRSTALDFANIDALDKIKNENAMQLAQLRNVHIDTKMGRTSADFNSIWKPYFMQQSQLLQTDLVEAKNNKATLAKLKADLDERLALEPFQESYSKAYTEYSADPTNKVKEKAYQDAYNKLKEETNKYASGEGYLNLLNQYKARGIDTSELEEEYKQKHLSKGENGMSSGYSFQGTVNKQGGRLEKLKALKSGGSTNKDDGPKRTRSKDLDRFQKAVKQAADSHDKALSRLAAATLMELKRTMGK